MAERFGDLVEEVRASFRSNYATLRVIRLQQIEAELLVGMLPVVRADSETPSTRRKQAK
jgi:hypothetical protein